MSDLDPAVPRERATAPPGVPPGALARRIAAIVSGTAVPCRIVLANGLAIGNGEAAPAFTITFHTMRSQLRLLAFGYVGLLESYFDGSVDVDGDLALAFRAGIDSGYDRVGNPLVALRNRFARRPARSI